MALGLALALLASPAGGSVRLEGIEFADRREWRGTTLRLQGAGALRYRLLFTGYVAALYLGEGVIAERALADVPRRLEIEYLWPIPAPAFAAATLEGVARNVDAAALERMRESVERLCALYEDVAPGDRYSLSYAPGIGTELAKNDESLGLIEGAEFSAALFAIWLGDRPLDETLRDRLLAGR
jgi:hypothetical protein